MVICPYPRIVRLCKSAFEKGPYCTVHFNLRKVVSVEDVLDPPSTCDLGTALQRIAPPRHTLLQYSHNSSATIVL